MTHRMNSTLDLFDLLDEDPNLLDGLFAGEGLDLFPDQPYPPQQQQQDPGGAPQPQQYGAQQLEGAEMLGFGAVGAVPEANQAPWSLGQQGISSGQQDQDVCMLNQEQAVFTSAEAATKYADTTALVAAAQAEMDAASPGLAAARIPLQSVVSATSIQLQEMAKSAYYASRASHQPHAAVQGTTGSAGMGLAQQQLMQQQHQAPQQQLLQQQQQQQQAPLQQQAPQQQQAPLQQQQQQPPFQQLMQQLHSGQQLVQQQPPPQYQHQQPLQQAMLPPRQPTYQPAAPPVSAAVLAKAAALSGKGHAAKVPLQPVAAFSACPPAQTPAASQSFPAALPALSMPFTAGMDSAVAHAAASVIRQQQAMGLVLPEQFKGVMLTPAGAVTGEQGSNALGF